VDIKSKSRIAFEIANYTVLSIVAILCILPLLHVVAVSFSSSTPATAGYVKLWPVGFTLKTYEYVLKRVEFITALFVSLKRVAIGVPLNLFMILMTAYPLSKTKSEFHHRTFFSWFFILTIYISGGLIPLFMTVRYTGLIDTIWALVIPNAVSIFNVILVMSFIRITIPKDIEESAIVRRAGRRHLAGAQVEDAHVISRHRRPVLVVGIPEHRVQTGVEVQQRSLGCRRRQI